MSSSSALQYSNLETLNFTFTLTEDVSDFHVEDVTVSGGTLSSFQGSGDTYRATFTPIGDGLKSIVVEKGKITDTAGNANFYPSETYEFMHDVTPPTISITSSTTSATAENITLTFYASEVIQNFHQYDISVIGGVLSEFSTVTDGRNYTAVLSPAAEYGETITTNVFVAASLFQDLAANDNVESETFEWTYVVFECGVVVFEHEVRDFNCFTFSCSNYHTQIEENITCIAHS